MARLTRTLGRNTNTMPFSVLIPQKWWTRDADQPGSGALFTTGCFAHEQLQSVLSAHMICINGYCSGGWNLYLKFCSEQDCYEDPQKENLNGEDSFSSSGEGDSSIIMVGVRGGLQEAQYYKGSIKLTHTYHVGPCRGLACSGADWIPPNPNNYCGDKYYSPRSPSIYTNGSFAGVPLGEIADSTIFNAPACLPIGDGTKVCAGSKFTDWLDIFELLESNPLFVDQGSVGPITALHEMYNFHMGQWAIFGGSQTGGFDSWNWLCPPPRQTGDECIDDWRKGWINESTRLNSCC